MELLLAPLVLVVYFLPTILAVVRKHRAPWAIAVVNVIFGLTGVGWLIALIWALNSNVREAKPA